MICLTTNRCAFSWTMTISRRNSRRNCCQNAYSTGITNFAEKAPAFRHGDESARQTWHFGKTLLQNDEVSGIIVASEERRAYYEEEVLPRKLKELEWERSAAMRDFI